MVQENTFNIQTSAGIKYLTQITPAQILSANRQYICSIVYFKQHLFLAAASYSDDNQSSIKVQILRTGNFLASWEEIYQTTVFKEEAGVAQPELHSSRIGKQTYRFK